MRPMSPFVPGSSRRVPLTRAVMLSCLVPLAGCWPFIGGEYHEYRTTCAEPTSTPYDPSLPAEMTVEELLNDSTTAWLPIGFDFEYFGEVYSEFAISSNGFITFVDREKHGCCEGAEMPDPDAPNAVVALAWTDLDPQSGGTISWGNDGESPNRRLVVRYDAVPVAAGGEGESLSGQIALEENSGLVLLFVEHFSSELATTQGVEAPDGYRGVCNAQRIARPLSLDNDGVRFATNAPRP